MRVAFRGSFGRDLKQIKDSDVLRQVRTAIEQAEAAPDIRSLPRLKKMSGAGGYYRIRIGDYRIGWPSNGTRWSSFGSFTDAISTAAFLEGYCLRLKNEVSTLDWRSASTRMLSIFPKSSNEPKPR